MDYKNGLFEYRTQPKYEITAMHITPMPPTISELKHDEVIVYADSECADLEIEEKRVIRFYKYIKQYCKHWEKEYSIGPVCDGTMWECNIHIDNYKLKAEGHQAFPKNFDTFLHKLTVLTKGKIFG